jgi:hypothetical protein
MSDEKTEDKPKAEDVPLGKGLADAAKKKILGRRKSVDDFVDRATKGQTTDSDN